MNQDIEALTRIQDLSAEEFERFKLAVHILTSKTFIIRGIDREREIYDFTIRNIRLFEAWFSCMDASLVRDESLGLVAFRGSGKTRLHFTREEICAVLALRLLYEDKKLEVSLAAFPAVTVTDFQQKYNAITGGEIRKTALGNVLRRLSSCKLVGIDTQDLSDPEGIIRLYPSIPLSIDRAALDDAIAFLANKSEAGASETGGDDSEVPQETE
ncbi:MAG: DUF4194 domain-containing protein [Treponema sp.]|jgi:hypothetical protein|nr:DUF4194 domain-containing protein [Treponema sp.]